MEPFGPPDDHFDLDDGYTNEFQRALAYNRMMARDDLKPLPEWEGWAIIAHVPRHCPSTDAVMFCEPCFISAHPTKEAAEAAMRDPEFYHDEDSRYELRPGGKAAAEAAHDEALAEEAARSERAAGTPSPF